MSEERTCRYFRGLRGGCSLGINIRELVGGSDFGWALRIPCIEDESSGRVSCEKRSPWTPKEARAIRKERERAVAAYMDALESHTCPNCRNQWQGRQNGPCVYCEHCGHRLYEGKLA